MKLRNLFLASVACAGLFTACSNEMDEVIDNGGNGTNNEGKAYASFAIQFPSGTDTRATTTEVGSTAENVVKDVTLLFFDATTHNLTDIKIIPAADMVKNDATYTAQNLVVTKGTRNIYAFVNAQAKIKALATNDNGYAYTLITGIGTEDAASMSGTNGFTMSNAEVVGTTEVKLTDKVEASKPENVINMKVERTVAKIQYTGNTFEFPVYNADATTQKGSVTLTDIELINKNDKYYYLRRVSSNATGTPFTIGGAEVDGVNYVVDPNFTYTATGTTWGKESKTIAKDAIFYCLENTMTKDAQVNGATTGAMFKAKFVMQGGNTGDNIYRYNGALYNKEADVKQAANITDNTAGWSIEQWKAKNVTFYAGGVCYYPYWIKHVDNGSVTEMGIMEFGVVRNNVYKLAVTSIKEIGAPTDDIDPENPDETAYSYLSVSVEVKEWTVRQNENIEL